MKVGRTALEAIRYCRTQGGFLQKTIAQNKSGNVEISFTLGAIAHGPQPAAHQPHPQERWRKCLGSLSKW
jgi:hypothetical protein